MGIVQIPAPVAGATRNVVAFTSSQTWTVPSSAKYVDVLVVGGGSGGEGGFRNSDSSGAGGWGGGVLIMKDIFLNGTGTVAITIGSGSNGVAGVASTTGPAIPSAASFSAFGTYAYASGGSRFLPGVGGYKGTSTSRPITYSSDTNQTNYAPLINYHNNWSWENAGASYYPAGTGFNSIGLVGGHGGQGAGTAGRASAGTHAGREFNSVIALRTMTLPTHTFANSDSVVGAAGAGTSGAGGAAGGAAGITGFAGGGGATNFTLTEQAGQGGAGAGGAGSRPNPVGGNGGNGGNAGANTGAGGGAGAHTGNGTGGTGGNGGNGGSGLVIVQWIS